MSIINKNNYEAFLLDYVEQNLSADMVAELMLFLEKNPELKAELEEFENVVFTVNPSTKFQDKQNLKQAAIEDLMIAEIEGLNTPKESKELFAEIEHNLTYHQLFSTYKKTILIPDPIVFFDKTSLKQKDTKVIPLYWWVSSAAAILAMFFLLKNFNTDSVEQISEVTPKKNVIKTLPIISTPEIKVNPSNTQEHNKPEIFHKEKQSKHKKSIQTQKIDKPEPNNNTTQTSNPKQLATNEMITIEPYEPEYITIEPLAENVEKAVGIKKDEFLSVAELLKKEVQKRVLENEAKSNSNELFAANFVAKVLGKKAEVETTEDASGNTETYALNIGGFSISRKIRK